jgi:hypothetical protein
MSRKRSTDGVLRRRIVWCYATVDLGPQLILRISLLPQPRHEPGHVLRQMGIDQRITADASSRDPALLQMFVGIAVRQVDTKRASRAAFATPTTPSALRPGRCLVISRCGK